MSLASPRALLRPCSPLEFAALFYLSLPLLIFFAGFASYVLAVPAVLTIAGTLYRLRPRPPLTSGLDRRQLLWCAAICTIYLICCGYAPGSGRSWDWIKHFAVINELAEQSWPPVRSDTQTFLRYYLGYYLLPGLLVKLFGSQLIEVFVFIQTWIGLFLLVALLLQKLRPKRPVVFIVLFLLFSGLDVVGSLLFDEKWSALAHKEWWAGLGRYAYEGHATLFLWVPQHALAGLLGLIVVLPEDTGEAPPPMLGLLGAAVAFWSPFAALGLAPFALAATFRSWRHVAADWSNILCGLLVGVPLLAYLLADTGAVQRGFNGRWDAASMALLASFLMLEVGVYLLALRLCCWHDLRYPLIVTAVLLLLPLYRVGLYNDFTMRTCIPALALIAIAASYGVSEAKGYAWIPLAFLMLIGSSTSLLEIVGRWRDGHVDAQGASLRSGILSEDARYFVQYNAALPHWVLRQ